MEISTTGTDTRAQLKRELCALVDATDDTYCAERRADWLLLSRRLRNQLDALYLSVLADFIDHRDDAVFGARNAEAWLVWQLHLGHNEATRDVATAKRLRDFDRTAGALDQGQVSVGQAATITRTLEEVGGNRVVESFPDDQGVLPPEPEITLLESARDELPRHFQQACARLKALLAPDRALAQSNQEIEREFLTLSEILDGRTLLRGEFGAENAARIQTMIDALTPAPIAGERRPLRERRAQALADAAEQMLSLGEVPTSGGERPHLALITDLGSLREEPGGLVSFLDANGEPVPGKLAQKLACDCSISPVVIDGKGDVLHVGRRRRTFSPAQRKAIAQRDGGCAWPGCDRPDRWCAGHHLRAWWLGGETDVENGALLCSHHHTLVHQFGWTLNRDGTTGRYTVTPPREQDQVHFGPLRPPDWSFRSG